MTALTCLTLASAACQAQSVTVYGRLALTANQVETGTNTVREVRDNAPRLGFRGVEDMGCGLKASFGLEMGFSADTGALGDPVFRNSYAVLAGNWGTVALGAWTRQTPRAPPPGSHCVSLNQPLSALISAALEPDSQNSFVASRLLAFEGGQLRRVVSLPPADTPAKLTR